MVIALGSNLGDRQYHLLRAVDALGEAVRVVRMSSIHETDPVDAPPPRFLNMVVTGYTSLDAQSLMDALLEIETRLGRAPRRVKNEARIIDLDLILHSSHRVRTKTLTLPHPRARDRAFVIEPLRVVWASGLPWFLDAER